ncbi:hypothetical protein MJ561_03070 [Klebsiella pneumoniae]|nr:hypothetical protein MJ561_03070 [Klebsiella pneumoniae]
MAIAIDGGDVHWQTHTVFNQPTPLNSNGNLFLSDTALREAVVREGADRMAICSPAFVATGDSRIAGLGRTANGNPPELLRAMTPPRRPAGRRALCRGTC